MADIRRQSIKGTIWVYVGFFLGAITTYLFTYKHWFTPDQYGLTRSLLEMGLLVYAFSSFGTTFYLYKFFPYYQDNLKQKDNDILGFSFKVTLIGFIVTGISLYLLQDLVIRKFKENSPLLVEHFYLILPVGFFMLLYNILESYAYGFSKGSTTNFLKETILKLYTLIIVCLKVLDIINLNVFLYLFSIQFGVIACLLLIILKKENKLWVNFKTSKVTRKFKKQIINMLSLTSLTIIISVLRTSIDAVVLAAKQGQGKVAIFGFAYLLVMPMYAPLRSLTSVTIPLLSRYWKDKCLKDIDRIYGRSSINLLSFSLFFFCLVLLNYTNAIHFFNINDKYLDGKIVFTLLGLVAIVELGTGVNSLIIGTSSFFRFELWTSILLTALIIPLSYFLTVKYGLWGPAIANLVSFTIYNSIRYFFLLRKFNMQPFSSKTIEVLLIATVGYWGTYFLFGTRDGLLLLIGRSILFCSFFIAMVYYRNISPDVKPVLQTVQKRIMKLFNR